MSTQPWDDLFLAATLPVTVNGQLCVIEDGALATQGGRIAWLGAMSTLPAMPNTLAKRTHTVDGALITPGLIDCHTHLVYAGNRATEFERRLQGESYESIARDGGGIQSTVAATRAASEEALFEESLVRAKALSASGVTTVEIKSGYGLDWETEAKMLRVAKRLETRLPLTVVRTFLAAHTVPLEYRGQQAAYVDLICNTWIPAVARENLAEAVDVFCESIAFTVAETEQLFKAATDHGLRVKCHGEQLSCSNSAVLAARYGALSVDHLEHVSETGVKAMAASGSVAVLLPGAYYYLRETQCPPIETMRAHGVSMAIATDSNPGTSPTTNLPLMMNMAATLFKLTPDEVYFGVTSHAAKALGLDADRGELCVGAVADLVCWHASHPRELAYRMGDVPLKWVMKGGALVPRGR